MLPYRRHRISNHLSFDLLLPLPHSRHREGVVPSHRFIIYTTDLLDESGQDASPVFSCGTVIGEWLFRMVAYVLEYRPERVDAVQSDIAITVHIPLAKARISRRVRCSVPSELLSRQFRMRADVSNGEYGGGNDLDMRWSPKRVRRLDFTAKVEKHFDAQVGVHDNVATWRELGELGAAEGEVAADAEGALAGHFCAI